MPASSIGSSACSSREKRQRSILLHSVFPHSIKPVNGTTQRRLWKWYCQVGRLSTVSARALRISLPSLLLSIPHRLIASTGSLPSRTIVGRNSSGKISPVLGCGCSHCLAVSRRGILSLRPIWTVVILIVPLLHIMGLLLLL